MLKQMLIYGDSNTYGYDPRGMLGMRYPYETIWTSIVRTELKGEYEIIEEGQNGRTLPSLPKDEPYLKSLTDRLAEGDTFVIMLGTNDILLTANPDPEAAVGRMKVLLSWTKSNLLGIQTVVIGPVQIEDRYGDMGEYAAASREMNLGFEALCSEQGIVFWDASKWEIPMAYDGVHFSEEGHRVFADRFIKCLLGTSKISQRKGRTVH